MYLLFALSGLFFGGCVDCSDAVCMDSHLQIDIIDEGGAPTGVDRLIYIIDGVDDEGHCANDECSSWELMPDVTGQENWLFEVEVELDGEWSSQDFLLDLTRPGCCKGSFNELWEFVL